MRLRLLPFVALVILSSALSVPSLLAASPFQPQSSPASLYVGLPARPSPSLAELLEPWMAGLPTLTGIVSI